MSELVPENVNQNWARQSQECDQPQHRAEREEPKFLPGPKTLRYGGPREDSKKCSGQNRADRKKKKRHDKFHPSRRDHERRHRGRAAPGWNHVRRNFYSAAERLGSASHCRSAVHWGILSQILV